MEGTIGPEIGRIVGWGEGPEKDAPLAHDAGGALRILNISIVFAFGVNSRRQFLSHPSIYSTRPAAGLLRLQPLTAPAIASFGFSSPFFFGLRAFSSFGDNRYLFLLWLRSYVFFFASWLNHHDTKSLSLLPHYLIHLLYVDGYVFRLPSSSTPTQLSVSHPLSVLHDLYEHATFEKVLFFKPIFSFFSLVLTFFSSLPFDLLLLCLPIMISIPLHRERRKRA